MGEEVCKDRIHNTKHNSTTNKMVGEILLVSNTAYHHMNYIYRHLIVAGMEL